MRDREVEAELRQFFRRFWRKGEHKDRTVEARGACGGEGRRFFVLSCFSEEVL